VRGAEQIVGVGNDAGKATKAVNAAQEAPGAFRAKAILPAAPDVPIMFSWPWKPLATHLPRAWQPSRLSSRQGIFADTLPAGGGARPDRQIAPLPNRSTHMRLGDQERRSHLIQGVLLLISVTLVIVGGGAMLFSGWKLFVH
jgi:hypothetical protein